MPLTHEAWRRVEEDEWVSWLSMGTFPTMSSATSVWSAAELFHYRQTRKDSVGHKVNIPHASVDGFTNIFIIESRRFMPQAYLPITMFTFSVLCLNLERLNHLRRVDYFLWRQLCGRGHKLTAKTLITDYWKLWLSSKVNGIYFAGVSRILLWTWPRLFKGWITLSTG